MVDTQSPVHTDEVRLIGAPTGRLLDRIIARRPLRPGELATPPAGSTAEPVRGDRGLPFLGMGLDYMQYGPAFQYELHRRHGDVAWFYAIGLKFLSVAGSDAVQAVLTNKDKAYASGWSHIGPWFEGGLVWRNGDEHRRHRRMIQNAYTPEALTAYQTPSAAAVDRIVETWPTGRVVKMLPTIRKLSMAASTEVFLAEPYQRDGAKIMHAIEACEMAIMSSVRFPVPGTPWYRGLKARKWLQDYLAAAAPAARARGGDDFFSIVCRATDENGDGLTDAELADHTILTLLASGDTTVYTTVAALYFLGLYPEWQQRAREQSLARGDGPLDGAGMRQLEVLDLVVKESMRLLPATPTQLRETVRDTELLGRFIPAGQLVTVCTGLNGLLPQYWSKPQTFDPDRFAEPRREDRAHRASWVPFGTGHHKCIGMDFGTMKVFTIIDAMLRRYEWRLPAGYDMSWRFRFPGGPSQGLPMTLTRLDRP
ncbi:putative cytochrome P450 [Nocardia nova SH22a]|uniref:Putative cytochrome P450 n=1 Tax=Nocardia nova SH22a TaxID=1415166 RepID=W5TTD7_9NOCA|nr:cytochrome P450 [Nocardia nova]AHH22193.1 putative cytochrome P450 [Nocardia nova SH22a]